ncbi:MAG: hypothetical protein MO846_05370 [Candidatus Devosia symbiotica]|nr:hypothetical protein [Candidatus Devosia symbiotica]
MADLLNRVRRDDDFSRALALLSTYPLTDDRKAAFARLSQQRPTSLEPPFNLRGMMAGDQSHVRWVPRPAEHGHQRQQGRDKMMLGGQIFKLGQCLVGISGLVEAAAAGCAY